MTLRRHRDKLVGALLVASLHTGAVWALWSQGVLPQATANFVIELITLAPPPGREPPAARAPAAPRQQLPAPPRPAPAEHLIASSAEPLAAAASVATATDVAPSVAAPPESPAASPQLPVALKEELALSCPQRTPPPYPALSRRRGETGSTLLRVELDEQGRVGAAEVVRGSGYARLDAAALDTVKTWHCQPAQQQGQAVRAVALQSFTFVLQGN